MSEAHPIRNKVVAGLITAGILSALSAVPALRRPFLQWCRRAIDTLTLPILFYLPVWALVCSLLLLAAFLAFLSWLFFRALTTPSWHQYVVDRFFDVVWRWEWSRGGPRSVWCYCPSDDTQLVASLTTDFRTILHCETCDTHFGPLRGNADDLIDRVKRQIDRNARTGEWSLPKTRGGV